MLSSDQTRAYFTQLRQELGQRILDKVYDPNTNKPSKVSYFKIDISIKQNYWHTRILLVRIFANCL